MELSLQTVFDVAVSYGLGDDAFQSSKLSSPPPAGETSINNPLGRGILYQLNTAKPDLVEEWRAAAAARADDPDMELGLETDENLDAVQSNREACAFRRHLQKITKEHGIRRCDITVYAMGVVFLRVDFEPGIPLPFLLGVARCFEFAAYEEKISTALLSTARQVAEDGLQGSRGGRRRSQKTSYIQTISKRSEPSVTDGESTLLSKQGITHIVMCLDEKDDVNEVKRRMLSNAAGYKELKFKYHGTLWYNWATCVVAPRPPRHEAPNSKLVSDGDSPGPYEQIFRIMHCVQIAHTFLGACQASEALISTEITNQASLHLQAKPAGRDPMDLTRLRTLALTVVDKTKYASLTDSEEDQSYFRSFEKNAKILERHNSIERQCGDLLASVVQAEQLRLERQFNMIVLCLTALTFLSAFADAYSFVKGGGEDLVTKQLHRSLMIMSILLAISGFVLFAVKSTLASWKK